MKRIFPMALFFSFFSPMAVNSDDWIYEINNICGRYYAVEINGGEAGRSLGLKDSVESAPDLISTVISLANFFPWALNPCFLISYSVVEVTVEIDVFSYLAKNRVYSDFLLGFQAFPSLSKKPVLNFLLTSFRFKNWEISRGLREYYL